MYPHQLFRSHSPERRIYCVLPEKKKKKKQKEGGQRIIEKKCNMEDYWSVKLDTLSLCYLLAPSCSLNKLYCWTAAIWISGPLSLVPALSSSALSSVPFSSCIPFALPAAPSWKGSTIRHPITDMTITQICGHTNQTVCTFRSLIWENQMRRWQEKKTDTTWRRNFERNQIFFIVKHWF